MPGARRPAAPPSHRLARLAPLGLGLALVLCLAPAVAGAGSVTRQLAVHATPDRLPPLTLQKSGAQDSRLQDLDSRLVILNFWSPSCPDSSRELAALDGLRSRFDRHELFIAPVVIGPMPKGPGAPETYGLPPAARPRIQLSLLGLPTTLLLNAKGEEIGRVAGAVDWVAPETVKLVALFARPADGSAVAPGLHDLPGISADRDFQTSFECY